MPGLSLVPKDRRFSVLLEQSGSNVVKISQQLRELVRLWENVKERVGIIADLEHEGDAISHQIMALLRRSFVTPFDREDIAQLAHCLDDIADFVHAAADAMLVYKVERPAAKSVELVNILVEAAIEVEKGVTEVFGRVGQESLVKRCVEVHRLENAADAVYRSVLVGLFAETADIGYLIKWRDIYKHIETAIDRCEDVANILEGVGLKYG